MGGVAASGRGAPPGSTPASAAGGGAGCGEGTSDGAESCGEDAGPPQASAMATKTLNRPSSDRIGKPPNPVDDAKTRDGRGGIPKRAAPRSAAGRACGSAGR